MHSRDCCLNWESVVSPAKQGGMDGYCFSRGDDGRAGNQVFRLPGAVKDHKRKAGDDEGKTSRGVEKNEVGPHGRYLVAH